MAQMTQSLQREKINKSISLRNIAYHMRHQRCGMAAREEKRRRRIINNQRSEEIISNGGIACMAWHEMAWQKAEKSAKHV